MMAQLPAARRYNLVTFTPDKIGVPVYLKLESAWVRKVGMQPDINRAIVPHAEAAKLAGNFDQIGKIEFWYTTLPGRGSADVTIRGERIVAAESLGLAETPDEGTIVAEYRLHFADFREDYVEPRGGRIEKGVVNKGPKPVAVSPGAGGTGTLPDPASIQMTLSQMLAEAIRAMGLSLTAPDTTGTDAPRDVQWLGNHAPAELKKLLDLAGLAFVARFDGTPDIQKIATDGDPPGLVEQLADQLTPQLDRRGASVVFSSYPHRIIYTRTSQSVGASSCFEFVCQDSTGTWTTLPRLDLLSPYLQDADKCIRDGFSLIDSKYRDGLAGQLYRCLRLSRAAGSLFAGTAGLVSVLTRRYEADLSDHEIQVQARIFRQDSDGTFSNTPDVASVKVLLKNDQDVLVLDKILGTVRGSGVRDQLSAWAGPSPYAVRFSHEGVKIDAVSGDKKSSYFHAGFSAGGPGAAPAAMSDGDIDNALSGKGGRDALILARPNFQMFNVDGQDVNRSDLTAKAQAEAALYLKGSQTPTRIISCRGFSPIEPGGLVTEVSWDQSNLKTSARIADWYIPDGAMEQNKELAKLEAGGGGGAYPGQANAESGRTALGTLGSTQPVLPVSAASPTVALSSQIVACQLTGTFPTAGGAYAAVQLGGKPSGVADLIDNSPYLEMPEGLVPAELDFFSILLCLEEDQLEGHRLDTSSYAIAMRLGYDPIHKRDVLAVTGGKGSRNNPKAIPGTDPGLSPDATSWSFDADGVPANLVKCYRVYWDGVGNRWLQFMRTEKFDAMGKLYEVSGETMQVITGTTPCTT